MPLLDRCNHDWVVESMSSSGRGAGGETLEFVRETSDESHTMDLYGRGME